MSATPCLFCRIAGHQIPSTAVFEDEAFYAFQDINPVAPTHVLVVPKKHVSDLADAAALDGAAVLGPLLVATARVAKELGLIDYRVVMNRGEGAGQSVFHLHVHLLAGRPFGWPPG